MKVRMKALNTFKGVEGFIIRESKFETTERRAKILKRRKLAKMVLPKENKVNKSDERKNEKTGQSFESESKEVIEEGEDNNEENGRVEEISLLDEEKYKVDDLEEVAKLLEMSGYSSLNKDELLKEVSEELVKREFSNLNGLGKDKLIELITEEELD